MDMVHMDLLPGNDEVYGTGDEVSRVISTIVAQP